jgi:hypothetical protein
MISRKSCGHFGTCACEGECDCTCGCATVVVAETAMTRDLDKLLEGYKVRMIDDEPTMAITRSELARFLFDEAVAEEANTKTEAHNTLEEYKKRRQHITDVMWTTTKKTEREAAEKLAEAVSRRARVLTP